MKVWIDILTPKQANFFSELQHRLSAKGFKTFLTTREYREVNELLELRRVKAVQVGRHGGGELQAKLVESAKRISGLARLVGEQNPDMAISFSSPEAARVAFGLKIPHYCVSDSPHAEAVCRLSIPLSQKLFTPWVIPVSAWVRYGISPRAIVRYRALDPVIWLTGHKTEPKLLGSLGIDVSKPLIVIRPPEEYAAYLSDHPSSSTIASDIIAKILDLAGASVQIVTLPRYANQLEHFKKRFGDRIIAPEHVIDAVPLMRASSAFIGGGGTMTAEAALLGVPAISYFPGDPTFVDRFLIGYGLVERIMDPSRVAQRVMAITKSREFQDFYRKRSSRLLKGMEDPLKLIMRRVFG